MKVGHILGGKDSVAIAIYLKQQYQASLISNSSFF